MTFKTWFSGKEKVTKCNLFFSLEPTLGVYQIYLFIWQLAGLGCWVGLVHRRAYCCNHIFWASLRRRVAVCVVFVSFFCCCCLGCSFFCVCVLAYSRSRASFPRRKKTTLKQQQKTGLLPRFELPNLRQLGRWSHQAEPLTFSTKKILPSTSARLFRTLAPFAVVVTIGAVIWCTHYARRASSWLFFCYSTLAGCVAVGDYILLVWETLI